MLHVSGESIARLAKVIPFSTQQRCQIWGTCSKRHRGNPLPKVPRCTSGLVGTLHGWNIEQLRHDQKTFLILLLLHVPDDNLLTHFIFSSYVQLCKTPYYKPTVRARAEMFSGTTNPIQIYWLSQTPFSGDNRTLGNPPTPSVATRLQITQVEENMKDAVVQKAGSEQSMQLPFINQTRVHCKVSPENGSCMVGKPMAEANRQLVEKPTVIPSSSSPPKSLG